MSNKFEEYEINIDSLAYMSDINLFEGTVIAKAIKKSFPNGGIVINTASSGYNKYLFKALENENIIYDKGYEIYNVFLTEKDVQAYEADTNVYLLSNIYYYS